MIILPSITQTLLTLIVLFILYVILVHVVVPLVKINSYRREDTVTYYFPVIGFLRLLKRDFSERGDIFGGIKEFTREFPNKKLFVGNIGRNVVINLRDTQYIKEFLQKQQYYQKAEIVQALLPLVGTGLLLAEGDAWKRQRKILSNSFHYEFIKDKIPLIQSTTKEFLDALSDQDLQQYSAIGKIQEITGEIVGRIFFGENLNNYKYEGKPLTIALAEIISDLGNHARSAPALLFGRKIIRMEIFPEHARTLKRVREFRAICKQIIEDRKAHPKQSNDMLGSLINAQNSGDAQNRLSDEDIINEFVTFFVAGMDTTGHLIGMSLYNLSQSQKYLEDLKKERVETFNTEDQITVDTLNKMDVLHSVLKETLRLHTPAPFTFPRIAIEDHNLGDLHVKKGMSVKPDFTSLFLSDKFFENPTQFNPSRWSNNLEKKLDSYAFTPFSAGPRNCIGQHLAIIESKIIISEFLNRFSYTISDDYKLKMIMRFLYEPFDELHLHLKRIN